MIPVPSGVRVWIAPRVASLYANRLEDLLPWNWTARRDTALAA